MFEFSKRQGHFILSRAVHCKNTAWEQAKIQNPSWRDQRVESLVCSHRLPLCVIVITTTRIPTLHQIIIAMYKLGLLEHFSYIITMCLGASYFMYNKPVPSCAIVVLLCAVRCRFQTFKYRIQNCETIFFSSVNPFSHQ